jgi:hypothetical protein
MSSTSPLEGVLYADAATATLRLRPKGGEVVDDVGVLRSERALWTTSVEGGEVVTCTIDVGLGQVRGQVVRSCGHQVYEMIALSDVLM